MTNISSILTFSLTPTTSISENFLTSASTSFKFNSFEIESLRANLNYKKVFSYKPKAKFYINNIMKLPIIIKKIKIIKCGMINLFNPITDT